MRWRRLWLGLFALALLTPLGLWLPQRFRAGPAWGEWSPEEVKRMMGYVPEGMKKGAELWRAPLPDYFPPKLHPSLGYLLSGLLGAGVTVALAYAMGRLLARRERNRGESAPTRTSHLPPGQR